MEREFTKFHGNLLLRFQDKLPWNVEQMDRNMDGPTNWGAPAAHMVEVVPCIKEQLTDLPMQTSLGKYSSLYI